MQKQLMASENGTLASSNTTAVVVDGRILQEQVMKDLMKAELTDWTIFEDGRMILNFELQGSRGLIVRTESPFTVERGYQFENGTVYSPTGEEL